MRPIRADAEFKVDVKSGEVTLQENGKSVEIGSQIVYVVN